MALGRDACYLLWRQVFAMAAGNMIFHATAIYDPSGNPATGVYNGGHGEMYVRSDRFASTVDLMNTVGHEAAHA